MSYSLEQLETESAETFSPKSAIEHVISLLKAEHADIYVILVYALAIGFLSLVVPIAVQTLVNMISFGAIFQPVLILTVIVLVMTTVSGALSLVQIWVVELLQRRLFVRIALDLALRIPRFQILVFRTEWPADLINRFFEVALVQKSISKLLLEGIALFLQASIGLLILSFYHPFLVVFVLAVVGGLVIILFILGRGAVRTSIKESSAKHSVLIWLENLAGHPLIFRSKIGSAYAFERADLVTSHYIQTREKHFKILFLQKIGFVFLQTVASATLLGLGGYLVIQRELSLGQLVASEIIVSGVLASFSKLGFLLESFYDLVASISKLDSLIELQVEPDKGDALRVDGEPLEILARNLTVQFSDDRVVFDDMNLHVKKGEKIAIYGKNGSGKSLFADLLLKFHIPQKGCLLLSGQDTRDLHPSSIRDKVQLIRNIEAFRGTIEDNIKLGQNELSNKRVREVLQALGLDEDLAQLKDGLRTWLREDGRPLSNGQASRLVLARALLMSPSLLVIDSLLDDLDREILLQLVLPTLKAIECTVCVLTHDADLASAFPTHYFLDNGKLSVLKQELSHG